MGRPGAGTGGRPGGTGSMHSASTMSRGSMHKVGNSVSRPSTSSIGHKSTSSLTTTRPKTSVTPSSRPTVNSNSRPSMTSSGNMMGGSSRIGHEDRHVSSYTPPKREPERRVLPPPPRYEQERRTSQTVQQRSKTERRVTPSYHYTERSTQTQTNYKSERRDQPRQTISNTDRVVVANMSDSQAGELNRILNGGDFKSSAREYELKKNTQSYYDSKEEKERCGQSSGTAMNSVRSTSRDTDVYKNTKGSDIKHYRNILISGIILLVSAFIIAMLSSIYKHRNDDTNVNRVKLETGFAYMNDCVDDELGWLDEKKVSKGIRKFWEDTGAQPYIWLHAYDGTDYSSDQYFDIALDYFDNVVGRQDAVMYVYFEKEDPDEVGEMAIVYGIQSGAIMDAEAEDIFWKHLDADWESYPEDQTDEMFIHVFTTTGNAIMYHRTTGWDVLSKALNVVIILCSLGALLCATIIAVKDINRRAKEKAEETERILSTPLEDLSKDKAEELLDKYK